ncbi:hypothetical protein L202_04017 [Cryptococcus amylolentus CBS 6039]|uniref:Major facilitator superfamily (MFS) profile domain-containing protein n=2 Tax=Cryptococcus amylolentus CBS 6039 TaxID=1295533 RepID=A0A1E3HPX2_9TREE|nr:hypothetical protein L202_04017 [Cryptococcus amylolentus CBS 6039]ODN78377.1 hypothetical protein L202_04017 [Cryptococcus amylolentus CBS 6039]
MFSSTSSDDSIPKPSEKAPRHASDREHIVALKSFGVDLHPETPMYVEDSTSLANAIGGSGLKDIFANSLVLMAAFSACMGGLLFGFDQGVVSIILTMDQFLSVFPEIDADVSSGASFNKGIMTALLELGAFIGALQAGFLADRYSRKKTIAIGAVWFIIGSIIQTTSYSFAQLVVGRFIGGLGVGVLSAVAPMYISECAPPNIRGSCLALEGSSIVIGIVIMFYITYATRYISNDWAFRAPFLLQMTPCIGLCIGLYKLPYSPRWLASVGRDQECLDALVRLRRFPTSDPRLQAEWITVRAEAVHNREVMLEEHPNLQGEDVWSQIKLEIASWIDMFRPKMIRRTSIGIVLMVFQQFLGINALIYYSPTLFEELGLDYQMQLDMSGVLNILQMLATFVAFFILDRVGRRAPLLIGSIVITSCHVIVAAIMAVYSKDWAAHMTQAWVAVAFIFLFMFAFGLGWSPVPWAMPAEINPSSRRAKGVAITTCACWAGNFIIGLITPPMLQHLKYGTFLFFAAFGLLSGIWTWFFCPETKGKTLEQMDEVFHTNTAHLDLIAKRDIEAIIMGTPAKPLARGRSDSSSSAVGEIVARFKSDSEKVGKDNVQEQWIEHA